MKKILLIFTLSVFGTLYSYAQHEMTLFHMNNVFQGSYVNPALIPESKVSLGLPIISSIYTGTYFSPFVARDLVLRDNDTTYRLGLDKAISRMSRTNNYLASNLNTDLFSLRFKARNLYISLSASTNTSMRFNFPKDLFSLIWYGNAQYIGNSASFDNLGINVNQYNEFALGIARSKLGGKFVYGFRFKVLQGLNNFNTAKSKASVEIDDQFYTHTLSGNIQANSASVFDYDSLGTAGYQIDYLSTFTNFKNMGYGIDLGLTWKPTRKLAISGAVNNLGFINWKTNAKSYTIDGTYKFNGINLDSLVSNGEVVLQSYLDSLKNKFGLKEQSVSRYRTYLTPSIYVSISYNLGRNTKIALTGYGEIYYGLRPAASIAFIQRAGRVLNFVVSYNVRKNSYNNVGLGIMFKPGPIQYYIVGDNLLPLNPFNSNNLFVRTGINLVFGKAKKPEMQTHNED